VASRAAPLSAMNYRHAYHAGNFADVLKHVVLVLCIAHLKRKDGAFRIVDTHAGAGAYRLDGSAAQATGEWQSGIGRLIGPGAAGLPAAAAVVLNPYLDLVRAENPIGSLVAYPGSPRIAQAMLRKGDMLIANEVEPAAAADLKALLGKDRQCKVTTFDGWIAIKTLLPPRERRGLLLVDPPFEQAGELQRMTQGLVDALERFASGIVLLWYPIKDPKPIRKFHAALEAVAGDRLLIAELMLRPARHPERLNGTGVAIVNPPFTLEHDLGTVLDVLSQRCGDADAGSFVLRRSAASRVAKS
jgi:23S rRNA (adenine2030-N6)-methyltransferase